LLCQICATKAESDILEDEDEADDAAAIAEARADIAQGRFISHEAMRRWLLSWGTPDERPPPEIGD
jgi:predicted transcriptional regulator